MLLIRLNIINMLVILRGQNSQTFHGLDFCLQHSIAVILNWGQFCSTEDIWQCLETFLTVTAGVGEASATSIQWKEDRDAAKLPTMQKLGSHDRTTQPKMSTVLRLRNYSTVRYNHWLGYVRPQALGTRSSGVFFFVCLFVLMAVPAAYVSFPGRV